MRILVFCGTKAAITHYAKHGYLTPAACDIAMALPLFNADENSRMAVNRSWLHGWHAPADTLVIFDSSWPYLPDSAESIQATARVDRANLGPSW